MCSVTICDGMALFYTIKLEETYNVDLRSFTYENLPSLKRLGWCITARFYVILQKNKLQRLDLSVRQRDKRKTVFFRSLWLEKIRTNRTCIHKSRYANHGLRYHYLAYYKWQIHDHRNATKKHLLKSHNLTPLL